MVNELILAPETEYDIADAYYWYENCRDGLGEEFLNSLNDCLDAIQTHLNYIALFMKIIGVACFGAFHIWFFMNISMIKLSFMVYFIHHVIPKSGVSVFYED